MMYTMDQLSANSSASNSSTSLNHHPQQQQQQQIRRTMDWQGSYPNQSPFSNSSSNMSNHHNIHDPCKYSIFYIYLLII